MSFFSLRLILTYCILLCKIIMMCQCKPDDISIMDLATPLNASLSAYYKRSFAYHTIKERVPRIVTTLIDSLVRNKDKITEEYGLEARTELKSVIGEISKLKYEIQTNKTMRDILSNGSDVAYYNNYLAKQPNVTYFTTIFLHAECYTYRRIKEIFELSEYFQNFDYFGEQKQLAFSKSVDEMIQFGDFLLNMFNESSTDDIKISFFKLLKLNLLGNKCDLSFSGGKVSSCENLYEMIIDFEKDILSDQSEDIWKAVSDLDADSQILDIILDNSGYETFTDFCLADFLLTKGIVQKVRFYVKSFPWFISDTTNADITFMLDQFSMSDNETLKILKQRWSNYINSQTWIIINDGFFTLPVDYTYMATDGTALYRQLSEAKLIIFKGDLNYRKLFGEKNWDPSTPCSEALQGFSPSKIAALRTLKSDIACGVKKEVVEDIEIRDPDWMINGKYGLIQYCDKI